MIKSIYIKNFKAFEKETIPFENHNILIGENDSGKSSILQALDVFFNQEKIEKAFVRDTSEPVEIGIIYNNKFYKKVYSGASYKLNTQSDNIEDIETLKYIYIPVSNYDPKSIITQLAMAKTLSNIPKELINQLKEISQKSIDDVIGSISNDLLVINEEKTNIVGVENIKIDGALKYSITSNGIPIEARGSGFQKNLIYALLVGNNYQNVILGIDEIENSFSINNCSNLIKEIQKRIGQTLISTHSKTVLEIANNSATIPLYTDKYDNLAKLIEALDNTKEKKYLLVEGKFDLPWYKRCLNILGKSSDYILLPAGGENNADALKKELHKLGKKCIIIKDGDTKSEISIKKDCIELYTPLECINEYFDLDLKTMPNSKEEFFEKTTIKDERPDNYVKRILASHANEFIDINNPLVKEVEVLLNKEI